MSFFFPEGSRELNKISEKYISNKIYKILGKIPNNEHCKIAHYSMTGNNYVVCKLKLNNKTSIASKILNYCKCEGFLGQ